MRISIIVIILLTLSLATGCSSKDITEHYYNYKGESEHWTAQYKGYTIDEFYKENGKLKCKEKADGNLVFTYKGDLSDLSSVREVGYNFKNGGGKRVSEQAPDKRTFSWDHGFSVSMLLENSENLEIIIDGKTETIEMKSIK